MKNLIFFFTLILFSSNLLASGGGNTINYVRISEENGVITVYGPSMEIDGSSYMFEPSADSAQGVCVAIGAHGESGSLDRPFFWRLPFTEKTLAHINRSNTRKWTTQGTMYMIQVYCHR